MRVIDIQMLNELRARASLPICTLLYLSIGDLQDYSTNNDAALAWGGQLWRPRGLSWNAVRLGKDEIVNSVSITIDDVDRAFYAPLMDEGPDAHPADVYLASLNSQYAIQATFLLFRGTIDSWQYGSGRLQLEIGSVLSQWSRSTLRLFSASCRWETFGGLECGYTGPIPTCSRTYLACIERNNTSNFGGFRWLPGLEGKKIAWGLVPDNPPT